MESLLGLIKNDSFVIISFAINVILLIAVVICIVLIKIINKKYITFMKKIGNGSNLDDMLKKYLEDVRGVKNDNSEIKAYYTKLDKDISSCIQKIGIVRYNAFQDVGSDLSFAIAFLDRKDNGVVLNGVYGSDSSNIYAKPIKNKQSSYQLSEEEKYALEIAEQGKTFITKYKK